MTKDDLLSLFEEIKATTKRHPLMIGFCHHDPTIKELQERLDNIVSLARYGIEELNFRGITI